MRDAPRQIQRQSHSRHPHHEQSHSAPAHGLEGGVPSSTHGMCKTCIRAGSPRFAASAWLVERYVSNTLQRTATHCNGKRAHARSDCGTRQNYHRSHTLQHTAIHCNTLQRTATHCNTLQRTATHHITLQHTASHRNTPQHIATYCNDKHAHAYSPCGSRRRTTTAALQHNATHCDTLRHTATHCNTNSQRGAVQCSAVQNMNVSRQETSYSCVFSSCAYKASAPGLGSESRPGLGAAPHGVGGKLKRYVYVIHGRVFICHMPHGTWLIHSWHASFIYDSGGMFMWYMVASYMWHASFICGTWLIHSWHASFIYDSGGM